MTNTASSVYDRATFDRVMTVFQKSYNVLAKCRNFELTMNGELVAPLPVRAYAVKHPVPASLMRTYECPVPPQSPYLRPLRSYLEMVPEPGNGSSSAEYDLI